MPLRKQFFVFYVSQPNPKANLSFDTNPPGQTKLNCRWRLKTKPFLFLFLMVKDFPNLFWLLYKFSNRIQMRKCPVKTTTPRRILCNSNFTSQSIRRKRSTQKTHDPQNRRPFHSRNIVCRRHEKTSYANRAKSWRRCRCPFMFSQCKLCRRLCHPIERVNIVAERRNPPNSNKTPPTTAGATRRRISITLCLELASGRQGIGFALQCYVIMDNNQNIGR